MNEEPKVTKETFPTYKPNPLLAGLPEYLKDPDNYPKVRKALLETLATTHSHSDILEWGSCVPCQRKLRDHAEMVRKFGFKSPAQYMEWQKVHETIKKRIALPKYNS